VASIITTVEQATPEWLGQILRSDGALEEGRIVDVRRRPNDAFNSTTTHLDVTYSADAPASAPQHLLLKLNHGHDGALEARFYSLVVELSADLPMLVRCYGAAHDETTGDSFCLLEDLSSTHTSPVTRQQVLALAGVPADDCLVGIVEALAKFHAYWWAHAQLRAATSRSGERPWYVEEVGEVRPWFRDTAYHRGHVRRRETEWATFLNDVGEWFPSDLRHLYERALADLPALWSRYLEQRTASLTNVTLTNGDCYFNQFLCPRHPRADTTRLIDFQAVSAGVGAYDLVYLFATFWTTAQRHDNDREERLLRYYHHTLQATGVTGYSWDNLLTDYKLMVAYMIFDPIWDQTSGASKNYWWPKLCCLTDAYRDLGCAELLASLPTWRVDE
jgi:hypothetical protein